MLIIKNDKCTLNITSLGSGYAHHNYSVELVDGEMPSHDDLITICDNIDFSGYVRHFGGKVHVAGNKANVKVYTD